MRFPFVLALLWLVDISRADVLGIDILKDVETILHNIAGRLNQQHVGQRKRAHSNNYYQQPQQQAESVNYGDVDIVNNYGPIGKRESQSLQHLLLRSAENKSRRQHSSGGLTYNPQPQSVNYGAVTINTNYGAIGKRNTHSTQHSKLRSAEKKTRRQYCSGCMSYQPQPQNVNYGTVNIGTNYGPIGKRSPVNYQNALYPSGTHQQQHIQFVTETAQQPTTEVIKPQPTQPSDTNHHKPEYVVYYNTGPVVANNNYAAIG